MAKIVIVGGTWDEAGGRESKVVKLLEQGVIASGCFDPKKDEIETYNGGIIHIDHAGFEDGMEELLFELIEVADDNDEPIDVIVWMPNIDNELAKAREVKKHFPKVIQITSKRNTEGKYKFQDVVAHGLSLKSNLILEILPHGKHFAVCLMDTLGNVWYVGTDWVEAGKQLAQRATVLANVTRQGTVQSPERIDPVAITEEISDFIKSIQRAGDIFHDLIRPAKSVERFLGNASFRCLSGFPSMRLDDRIYVSKRNVDKRSMGLDAFVQVGLNGVTGVVWYRGDHKPSVDTVIQVRLYALLPKVRFMLHSHVYIKGAPYTDTMIPCGGLQEVNEVIRVVMNHDYQDKDHFAINLKGHGSIMFMSKPSDYYEYERFFKRRPWPEQMGGK